MLDEKLPGAFVTRAACAGQGEVGEMEAFQVSGYDAIVGQRNREAGRGAAFEGALELIVGKVPAERNGSFLPATRDGSADRGGKPRRFIGWHLSGSAEE